MLYLTKKLVVRATIARLSQRPWFERTTAAPEVLQHLAGMDLWLNTWVIPPLELILCPDGSGYEMRDARVAARQERDARIAARQDIYLIVPGPEKTNAR